jgi:hypothetical protein
VITGLLLALLASFALIDNAALAATPATTPAPAAVAEDAVATRPGEHVAVAAPARSRNSARVRCAAVAGRVRPRLVRRPRSADPWCAAPVPRQLAGRAPPEVRAA